ncbi:hypothetical protein EB001_18745, partial [bacterium]|nr:hypothetical protein [bacterium]
NFLIEVLKRELLEDVPNLFIIHNDMYTRCSNVVTVYNNEYNDLAENSSECTAESIAEYQDEPPKALAFAVSEDEDEDEPPKKSEDLSEDPVLAECIKKYIGDKRPECTPGKVIKNTLTIEDARKLLECKGIDHSDMDNKTKLCAALVKNGLIPDPTVKKGGQIDYNKECQIM